MAPFVPWGIALTVMLPPQEFESDESMNSKALVIFMVHWTHPCYFLYTMLTVYSLGSMIPINMLFEFEVPSLPLRYVFLVTDDISCSQSIDCVGIYAGIYSECNIADSSVVSPGDFFH